LLESRLGEGFAATTIRRSIGSPPQVDLDPLTEKLALQKQVWPLQSSRCSSEFSNSAIITINILLT
jgi:hypothetical protein